MAVPATATKVFAVVIGTTAAAWAIAISISTIAWAIWAIDGG
ncbi:unannotated protein [freshwater metagenome]|uniref:Unannotated protein n=1 Tax=freshwater metagenome TaxID=449393 RepID=A0A6J7U8G4_9ZZZZ